MTITEFIQNNIDLTLDPVIVAVLITVIFLLVYDFYHLLFSSVLTWFKK